MTAKGYIMELQVHIKKRLGEFCLEADLTSGNELISLLGPSGCGKTLTLKCIAGIERPDEGRIVLDGHVLFDSDKKVNLPPQKRRVGYMFQDYALFPNMTVRQNILAGMGRKPDPSLADPFLERFRIAELSNRLPRELSGGQKQRTAMARIAAQDPDVILLDEPFSALDTMLKWELENEMIQMLSKEKKPAIFVSHDLDEVYRMGGNVCLMKEGRTGAILSTEQFFDELKKGSSELMPGWKVIPPGE